MFGGGSGSSASNKAESPNAHTSAGASNTAAVPATGATTSHNERQVGTNNEAGATGAATASFIPFPSSSAPSSSDLTASTRPSGNSAPPEAKGHSPSTAASKTTEQATSGDKRSGNGSPPVSGTAAEQKKRRSSGVSSKASSLLASAKNTLNFGQAVSRTNPDLDSGSTNQTPLQKLGKQDPALAIPQGQHNNSAGESLPGPRSTFRVGVWEDRNKKCRRTMEDTHAFLYNFLPTPAPASALGPSANVGSDGEGEGQAPAKPGDDAADLQSQSVRTAGVDEMLETDNGYFAIFDGHAGTFAADWCGKKLHIILEETIRKNPNVAVPELLDQTFTSVDAQLEKLPVKNSGCTAAIALLRWEDRVPSSQSATGSQLIWAASAAAAAKAAEDGAKTDDRRLKASASRQRVLYTANVGDARIILCRSGKALRLSYDHKGSDENEGKRIANAGGLILNNRVNGVLAVTRALGDTYMKDLVTGHPYTTETVIQPDIDEFIIIACDGLWDVCDDQEAVDRVRNIQDPVAAAKLLVDHALARFSTDNLSCMIVRLDRQAHLESQASKDHIGVEGDSAGSTGKATEADHIVNATKQTIADGVGPAGGVLASNSGRSHDAIPSITEEPPQVCVVSPVAQPETDTAKH